MDTEKNNTEDIVAFKVRRSVAKQSLKKASKLVTQWQEEEKLEGVYLKRILFLFCVLSALIFTYWLIFN